MLYVLRQAQRLIFLFLFTCTYLAAAEHVFQLPIRSSTQAMQDFFYSDANATTELVRVNNNTYFATKPQLQNIESIITV